MTTGLLTGVRVIEMAEALAGPHGGSLLGDLGADVVKIESFPRASVTRSSFAARTAWGGGIGSGPAYERNAGHHGVNRNKRNIALNIRTEAGAEVVRKLVAGADVVFEGFSAGTMERAGFGWEQLRPLNPRLVMISMPGWGVKGPYKGYVTFGSGIDATLGHVSIRGYPDLDTEFVPGVIHSDATATLTVVFAVISGLRGRDKTGEGCFIDMSQAETLGWQLPAPLAEWTLNGRLPRRLGNADPQIVPHGCYPAAGDDTWVGVAAENDAQWAGLAALLGHPEWGADGHPWASVVGRLRARREIDEAITAYTASRDPADAAEEVQAAGAIAAPVVAPAAMLASPQLHARGWFQTVNHRYAGEHLESGFLWSIAEDPPILDRPTGLVGEHNVEVLSEIGYTAEEIAALEREGVIGDRYGE